MSGERPIRPEQPTAGLLPLFPHAGRLFPRGFTPPVALSRPAVPAKMPPHSSERQPMATNKMKKRSSMMTEGDKRAPNRAMLRAVGFKDGDFKKPIIGV